MFDAFRKTLASLTNAKEIGAVGRFTVSNVRKNVGTAIALWREARQKRYTPIPYEDMMARWAIDDSNRRTVVRNLRIGQGIFALALGITLLSIETLARLSVSGSLFFAASVIILCATEFLIYEWRVRMINQRQPVIPFLAWLIEK